MQCQPILFERKEIEDVCMCKGLIDKITDQEDLFIGFDPKEVIKNRKELKINLIYFDENIANNDKKSSYYYYKNFKVDVVGIFYPADEIEIFRLYLYTMQQEQKAPPFVVVVTPKNFEEVYNISLSYNFIKEIIIIDESKQQYDDMMIIF